VLGVGSVSVSLAEDARELGLALHESSAHDLSFPSTPTRARTSTRARARSQLVVLGAVAAALRGHAAGFAADGE
jgi:hypothetical protein